MKKIRSFGSWSSPVHAGVLSSSGRSFAEPRPDGSCLYWLEGRPEEGGRSVLMRREANGEVTEVLPVSFSVRSRVHEYGGGAYGVLDGTVYFVHFDDQRIYRQDEGEQPAPLTPPDPASRYGDLVPLGDGVLAVQEVHRETGEPLNRLVHVTRDQVRCLYEGSDFVSSPILSPDGKQLAWLSWDHPGMPWDGTRLHLAPWQSTGKLVDRVVAGGPEESVFQPGFSSTGTLHFVSDQNGWWNHYVLEGGRPVPLLEEEKEYGMPQWGLGMSTWAFVDEDHLVCTVNNRCEFELVLLHIRSGRIRSLECPFTVITALHCAGRRAVFTGSGQGEASCVVTMDLDSGTWEVVRRSPLPPIPAGSISKARSISFPTSDGDTAHGFFYPPANADFAGPEGEKPPLLVFCHGGPTGMASGSLKPQQQYWTSRGFAILDVNYRGSVGFGRRFRERLKGKWGIYDVDDCISGARYLAARGLVDADRMAIRGGSAGGYTVLCALTFHDIFKAGASYYGISDLVMLEEGTHKFESRYVGELVGRGVGHDEYRRRSPLQAVDRLSCPVIFFQGLEDRVVPSEQAERMVEALRRKNLPVAWVPFAGEYHGFRKAENIRRAQEAELRFYGRIFGFATEPAVPLEVENLPAPAP